MAMKIDLKNPNPGVTFYFDESDKKEGHIVLRVLNGAKLEKITNQCRQKRVEVKGSPPTRFEYLDFKKNGEDKEFEMTWDYCIMSWEKVIDGDGKDIPCSPESKVNLMRESPMFSSFVMDCVRKVNISNKIQDEDLEGN
jgi:hypothetical protein